MAPQHPSARGWWRAGLAGVLAIAAALRLYPILAPYHHPEQELVPLQALEALVRHDWKPVFLFHGTGFVYALRALYTIWYAVGLAVGAWTDRLGVLVAWVRDPWPFVIAGRFVVALAGIATVGLLVLLGRAAFGRVAGITAGALLAVSFIHVRESHHVWYDVPATMFVVAALLVALRAVRTGRLATVGLAGALAGAAVATKHSVVAIVVPTMLAAWWAVPVPRLASLAVAAGASFGVYALLNPYTLLAVPDFLVTARIAYGTFTGGGAEAASFARLAWASYGVVLPLVAAAGVVVAWRSDRREAALLVLFPVLYLCIVGAGQRIHARYFAPAVPLLALFAAVALGAAARRLAPARPVPVLVALTVLAGLENTYASVVWVRLLGRADTRALAGEWIAEHVPPGTPISVPAANGYPNPVLPWDATRVALTFPAWREQLLARGVTAPDRSWPLAFQTGVFGDFNDAWQPSTSVVVTAEHPGAIASSQTPPAVVARLRAAGYRPVDTIVGFEPPLRAVFDPIDADYLPIARFCGIVRPGPTLTIWQRSPAAAP